MITKSEFKDLVEMLYGLPAYRSTMEIQRTAAICKKLITEFDEIWDELEENKLREKVRDITF